MLSAILFLLACDPQAPLDRDAAAFAPEPSDGVSERTLTRLTVQGPLTPIAGTTATYVVRGARPNARVDLWASRDLVGRGVVFARQQLYLAIAAPTLFRLTTQADGAGVATFSITWRGSVGDRVEIQAFTPVGGDWYVTPSAIVQLVAPVCGDGILTAPEACDDGNLSIGDGCDAACQIETCTDADADGVCDDDDVCPAGSDAIDLNGNLVPDACEGVCACFDVATLDAAAALTASLTWLGPGAYPEIDYSVEGLGTGVDPIYWRARTGTFTGPPPFNDWCDYGAPAPISGGSATTQWITPIEQQACADLLFSWGAVHGAGW